MLETLQKWDLDLLVFLNNLGIERYDGFWVLVTQPVTWVFLYVLMVFLVYKAYGIKKGILVMLYFFGCIVFSIFLMTATKYMVARVRPNNIPELAGLIRAIQTPHNYSFYSGHASSSFAIATFMVLALRHYFKWVYLFFLFPILYTLSRIYVGVHYPSDLLVGALMGTLVAFIFYKRCSLYLEKKRNIASDKG